jgi:hypothetical protein
MQNRAEMALVTAASTEPYLHTVLCEPSIEKNKSKLDSPSVFRHYCMTAILKMKSYIFQIIYLSQSFEKLSVTQPVTYSSVRLEKEYNQLFPF